MQAYRLSLPPVPSSCGVIGDLDCSGILDILDLQRLVNVLLGLETDPQVIARGDLDGDGSATILDLQRLVNTLLGL